MIVRTLQDAEHSPRHIKTGLWDSIRLILKDDNMGFSFHITTITAGAEFPMQYLNHLESVYCISGQGTVKTLEDGRSYAIEPGTVYALDRHDRHILHAVTELKLACVFTPPLSGKEVHDSDGSYPAAMEKPANEQA